MEKTFTELRFFYGSSNPELGKKITNALGITEGKITLKKFANGETYAQFMENIRGKDVFLMQTAVNPINDNLVELLVMIDAAKRASAGRITIITPNYFYARQDRKAASREPITAKLVADLLTTAGADRVMTLDLHSDQTQGFFNIPMDNLPTTKILIEQAKKYINGEPAVIVAPDAGSAKEATQIALAMKLELSIINKMRTAHNEAKALNIIGSEVEGKTCLMFDDMIDTGGSICKAAEILKQNGAKKIIVFATHGVFSLDAIEKINSSQINKVIVTDTLPLTERASGCVSGCNCECECTQPNSKEIKKIEVVTVSNYLAKAIRCINNDESVSILGDYFTN
jgi:ribose-phosphate pyrophosphokinase